MFFTISQNIRKTHSLNLANVILKFPACSEENMHTGHTQSVSDKVLLTMFLDIVHLSVDN